MKICASHFCCDFLSLSKPGGGAGRTLVEVTMALVLLGLKGVVFLGRITLGLLSGELLLDVSDVFAAVTVFIGCVLGLKGFV